MSLREKVEPAGLSPSELWAALEPETRRLASEAFYDRGGQGGAGRREADLAVASALRFREAAVRKLPVERRIDYLLRVVRVDDSLACSLLLALHLEHRVPLLEAFLDRLGVPQIGGLIDEDWDLEPPGREKLAAAAEGIRGQFPAEEVDLYLLSLLAMDPETWGELADLF
jgi:hypothetical protein